MLVRLRGVMSGLLQPPHRGRRWDEAINIPFRELDESHRDAFRALGCGARHPFFGHRIHYLPQAGPDGLRVAGWLCGVRNPDQLWEIVLHAQHAALDGFPPDLFMDEDVVWHQQHFGLPGHIAYAIVAVVGRDLFALAYVSDVVQRIGRRRELKTRVESRFRAWPRLLVNAVLAFAVERGLRRVFSPSAEAVWAHTDPLRDVQPGLFERIYDRTVTRSYLTQRAGRWWALDLAANRPRIVMPAVGAEQVQRGKSVCICHDTERHWGHVREDPAFAERIREPSRRFLDEMLEIERSLGARTTYCVVGRFLPEVRELIAERGHSIAFHSYDHNLSAPQLARCRTVDPRIAGYRPPQSRRALELRDSNLCRHNFQWLATARAVLPDAAPILQRRVVKIPILFDDYPLHRALTSYGEWEAQALATVERQAFVAFGLHDCYGAAWLPHYRQFLEQLLARASLTTGDQVARSVVLANGC